MNNLFESVVLGHQSPHHLRQSYGDLGETIGEGCQQPLGLVEPLLSSSVVGQTQEVGRRHRVGARLSSILIWSNTHGGEGETTLHSDTLYWLVRLLAVKPTATASSAKNWRQRFFIWILCIWSFFFLIWLIGWNVSPNLFDVCIDLFPFGKQVIGKKNTTEDDDRGLLPVTFKWDEQNVFVINWVFH